MVGRLKNAAGGNGNPIVVIADVKWYVKLHRLPNVITKLSIGPSFRIGDMHYGRCNANSIDASNGDKYPNNFAHKGYSRFTIHKFATKVQKICEVHKKIAKYFVQTCWKVVKSLKIGNIYAIKFAYMIFLQ